MKTPSSPSSPYSASKAASQHYSSSWQHTYGLPLVIAKGSNHYGHWQLPEELIQNVTLKALSNKPTRLYGDGENIRDWRFAEDHVDTLFLTYTKWEVGTSDCIGGEEEKTRRRTEKLLNIFVFF